MPHRNASGISHWQSHSGMQTAESTTQMHDQEYTASKMHALGSMQEGLGGVSARYGALRFGLRLATSKKRAMRQRILGSHTPPCHRRMVITTLSSMFCLAALQRKPDQCRMLPCIRHSRWLSKVLKLSGSAGSHHPPTAPVSLKPLALWVSLSLCASFSSPSQGGMSYSSPSQGGFSSSSPSPQVSLCPSLPFVSASP